MNILNLSVDALPGAQAVTIDFSDPKTNEVFSLRLTTNSTLVKTQDQLLIDAHDGIAAVLRKLGLKDAVLTADSGTVLEDSNPETPEIGILENLAAAGKHVLEAAEDVAQDVSNFVQSEPVQEALNAGEVLVEKAEDAVTSGLEKTEKAIIEKVTEVKDVTKKKLKDVADKALS
jgi:hypothetical protein